MTLICLSGERNSVTYDSARDGEVPRAADWQSAALSDQPKHAGTGSSTFQGDASLLLTEQSVVLTSLTQ